MKKLIILSLFCLILSLAISTPVSETEALNLARDWMRLLVPANPVSEVSPIANPLHNSQIDWYEVTFAEGGFALISAEDKAVPILGYSPAGSLSSATLPSNLEWFLSQYHEEMALLRSEQTLSVHEGWQAVRSGDFSAFLPDRPVSPLLSTNWDQNWPYNSLCPSDASGPGGHVYAGCGATTMGQIMKFWAYPTQGTGSNSYTHPVYGVISANFGATTYNYASMPNSLYWTPNTNISTLLFHCGVALNMNYSPNGSGSYVTSVRPAFVNYFNYESTAQTLYKYAYSNDNWEALLRNELEHGRPIFYHGQDTSNGGHAWVCDGYQGTNYFHMNWGWSGYYNGYFYLTNLNPGSYNFVSQQGAIIGLRPTAPITAPTNLVATADAGNNIFLEWENPLNRALLGYNIYRSGTLYTTIEDPLTTYFFDINMLPGTYQYFVTANFTQGESDPSNTAVATIYPAPVINLQESFEQMDDFTTDLYPWFGFDVDQAPTVQFDNLDFPSEGSSMSFMVFNPAATVPPIPEFNAFDGGKLIVCLPAVGVANDDWFATPKWNTGNQARMRFWAKSALTDSGLAQIKVGISTTTPEPANMTIISGAEPISVPAEWTGYDFSFPGNLYTNVFVGIHCSSDNGSALLLDKFQLWSSFVENEDELIPSAPEPSLRAYPNPFRSSVRIDLNMKNNDSATLRIYDLKGRLVRTLAQDVKTAGTLSLTWDGDDHQGRQAANGIYYCRLSTSSGQMATQKLVLLK